MHLKKIVILGTGGTIAGTSGNELGNIDYTAGKIDADQLLLAIPQLAGAADLSCEQVAQIDSKDMTFAVLAKLAERVSHHLAFADVQGVVITHGTDTLEETAYFLHAVLGTSKPVVLTCSMRPATAFNADGPQNLLDAVAVARHPGASGVVAVCAGTIHGATDVQKVHPYRLNAFASGDAGAIGYIEENKLRLVRNWPVAHALRLHSAIELIAILKSTVDKTSWPSVEIVMNYAGANGTQVDALVGLGVQGIVVAGTGNGSVHLVLEAALLRARDAGVTVVLASRCPEGRVLRRATEIFDDSHGLSPVKARIALMLRLLSPVSA